MRLLVSIAIIMCTVLMAQSADAPPVPLAPNSPPQIAAITLSPEEYVKVMNVLNSMPRGLVENLAIFLENKEFQAQAAAGAIPPASSTTRKVP